MVTFVVPTMINIHKLQDVEVSQQFGTHMDWEGGLIDGDYWIS